MIAPGTQPPNPDLEDDDTPYSISAEDLTIAGGSSILIATTANTGLTYGLTYDITEAPTIDTLMKLADENLLQAIETVTREQVETISEDEFKKRTKSVLSKKLMEEVTKKTKFTMLKDPRQETIVTRAKVYVFSEQDLRFFIENLTKNS